MLYPTELRGQSCHDGRSVADVAEAWMIAVSRAPGLAFDQLEEALGHHEYSGVLRGDRRGG